VAAQLIYARRRVWRTAEEGAGFEVVFDISRLRNRSAPTPQARAARGTNIDIFEDGDDEDIQD
jgi:hypothetical protein